MRTTTEPRIDASTVHCRSTGLPVIRVSTSASRRRRAASSSTAERTSATSRCRRRAACLASSLAVSPRPRPSRRTTQRSARAAARSPARPRSRSATSACLWSTGRSGSLSALRSRTWVVSSLATAASSAATRSSASRPSASSSSRRASPVSACSAIGPAGALRAAGHRAGLGVVAELLDELVDEAELALAVEGVVDHPGGQLDRQAADLAPQVAHCLVALAADGLAGALQLAARLVLGLAADLAAQPLGGAARLLDDPLGLLLGRRQPFAVLVEQPVGLGTLPLGRLELALDAGAAVAVGLLDRRPHQLDDHEQQHEEADRAPDQLGGRGQDRVLRLPFRGGEDQV